MPDDATPAFPPYAYVPGGPWPHPTGSPHGHSFGHNLSATPPIVEDDWRSSPEYVRGVDLFNAGYYWEAHESWESLWHAHGRKGPTADTLKGLIKLAAAGVKVREGQPHGVVTHARRAADLFATVLLENGPRLLGLDLETCERAARGVAEDPPVDAGGKDAGVTRVFPFRIEPGSGVEQGP